MTAKSFGTAASAAALPNNWDDAEEWEPMAERCCNKGERTFGTAAAPVVPLPDDWDDAEEWEPMVKRSSALVVRFPNVDAADGGTRAPADTARGSADEKGR